MKIDGKVKTGTYKYWALKYNNQKHDFNKKPQ